MLLKKIIIIEANRDQADCLKNRVSKSVAIDHIVCVSSKDDINHLDDIDSNLLLWSNCQLDQDFVYQVKSLKTLFPKIKIILLSDMQDPENLCKIIALGVNGFILKNEPEDFCDNMLKSLNFDIFPFSNKVIKLLAKALLPSMQGRRRAKLTNRENDVLNCLVRGLSNKAIARHLGVSAYTVADHNKSIFNKYNVRSRTELVSLQLNY
jgi:two-component system nitrate/nitrite response regulator NarL